MRKVNGVEVDEDTGRFLRKGLEATKTLGVRLPLSLWETISNLPDKNEWVKDVLIKAIEARVKDESK